MHYIGYVNSNNNSMNQSQNIYASPDVVAAQPVATRATFIRKTYLHLAGALGVFCALLYVFCSAVINSGNTEKVLSYTSGYGWFVVLGSFMAISWIADKWARSSTSKAMQYAGLALYTVGEALIFTPLILVVFYYLGVESSVALLGKAGLITISLFAGLSLIALTTKKDFSFLGGILKIGGLVALGFIAVSIFAGFDLGILFSSIMVIFAGVSILYNTSNMIHHYRTDQYVAASLGLFASIALLLWYVINILLSLGSGD